MISANFLSGESECGVDLDEDLPSNHTHGLTPEEIAEERANLAIPYSITGGVVALGGFVLLGLYLYKKYIPPKERKLPQSFDEQMPKQLNRIDKLILWKKSVPSFYIISIISLGSLMIWSYYGFEMTYFQFLAQFTTATPLPIAGSMSANLEAATGGAYAFGGFLAILASLRFHPEHMIYVNFVLMNIGNVIMILVYRSSLSWYWIGNIFIGFG